MKTLYEKKEMPDSCLLSPMLVIAILLEGREHPCDRCNHDRNICKGYPRSDCQHGKTHNLYGG